MTKRNRRLIFVGAIFTVAIAAVALILNALSDAVAYFYTPSQLQALASPPAGAIRLGGLVKEGSIRLSDDDKAFVTFAIRDEIAETPVSYRGVLPDLFSEGKGVIVQGALNSAGELVASEVLAKHDENYMPKEVADALKKQGRWQEGEPR